MLADKDGNGEIDKQEFGDFYKIVQASVKDDMDLKNIVYTATTVAQHGAQIQAEWMCKVMKCFGVIVTPKTLTKKVYTKEEFLHEVARFFE
jgi:hypothetical protein